MRNKITAWGLISIIACLVTGSRTSAEWDISDCDMALHIFWRGQYAQTETHSLYFYEKAIELCPGFIRPYELVGNYYRKQNNSEKAIDIFMKAAELGSVNYKLYYLLASLFFDRGDLDMGHQHLIKSLSIRSDYPKALELKAKIERATDTTGPHIRLYEPAAPKGIKVSFSSEVMTIRGVVTDMSGVAWLRINKQEAVLDKDGRFLKDIPLKVGRNHMELEATDETGNRSALLVTVERETQPEVAATMSPEDKKANAERQTKIETELAEQKELEARIGSQQKLEAEHLRQKALAEIKARKETLILELAKAKNLEYELAKEAVAAKGVIAAGRRGTARQFYRKSFAVVVGINGYEKWPGLEFGIADAKAVKARLEEEGFDDITVIMDREATQRGILTALYDYLPRKVQRDDRVLFYFAGHGQTHELPGGGKQGYIIPVDAGVDNYTSTGISMDQIRGLSSRIAAKHIIYIMDSCYSGLGFSRGMTTVSPEWEGYLRKISSVRVVQIITAGGKGEQVKEKEGHGLFTTYFLKALEGNGDLNKDNVVTGTELGAYLRPAVSNASGHTQTPLYGRLEGEGEFLFFVENK